MLKTDILKKLKMSDDFVSGQELCDTFNVSRTAVWKAVNTLKSEGYLIESVTNKGYHLKDTADVLTGSEVESLLRTNWLGHPLTCYEEIDSTNTQLKRMADENPSLSQGTLLVADRQIQGKGRRGRGWENPASTNIAMSFLLKPDYAPDKASMLTIIAALAVAKGTDDLLKTIKGSSGEEIPSCTIKWPNDVLINKKKYCGILTEMSLVENYIGYVIVGIGINVNNAAFPEEIKDMASSIFLETGEKIHRAALINCILCAFEEYNELFEKHQSLAPLALEYNRRLVSMDATVRVLDPKGEFTGISKGINEKGELIVEKENGESVAVYAGEVSVRGIYGYV